MRKGDAEDSTLLIVCNFTPVLRENFSVGVPEGGTWEEVFNSDAKDFGGSGYHVNESLEAVKKAQHGRAYSLSVKLPPLAAIVVQRSR